jgi:hypothetical protein
MTSWFQNPIELFRVDKIHEFWPTEKQTAEERINAASRFIIYATCILYLIRRDIRVFILGAMALGVLYIMERNDMVKFYDCEGSSGKDLDGNDVSESNRCTEVNSSMEDFDTVKYGPSRSRGVGPEYHQNAFDRQFISSPHGGDQTEFAEWLYGKKNASMCKTDPSSCDPNARGAQLEAFGGVPSDGVFR